MGWFLVLYFFERSVAGGAVREPVQGLGMNAPAWEAGNMPRRLKG
jgi:hypothetical protein